MKNDTKNTGTKNATAQLAEINAQLEALNQQRIGLAQPLKDRYVEMRGELLVLETGNTVSRRKLETGVSSPEGRGENCRGHYRPRFTFDHRQPYTQRRIQFVEIEEHPQKEVHRPEGDFHTRRRQIRTQGCGVTVTVSKSHPRQSRRGFFVRSVTSETCLAPLMEA